MEETNMTCDKERLSIARGGVLAGALALAAALLSSGCDQPQIQCTAGHGEFALKYTPVSGSGACAMVPGSVVGVQAYVKGTAGRPQFDKPPMALKPAEIGELVDTYMQPVDNNKLSAQGDFAVSEPGADGFCSTNMLTPAAVTLAPVPAMTNAMGMMTPARPAVSVTYEFSDVKFYVTAANPGTMATGKVKYTIDGCTAEYSFVGLSPAVACEETDADGEGTGKPDDSLCNPCADVAAGRSTGSGIAPNVETVCDPQLLYCVPKNPLPSLRPPVVCKPSSPPDAGATPDTGGGMTTPDAGAPADGGASG